jgi:hypothetical protein
LFLLMWRLFCLGTDSVCNEMKIYIYNHLSINLANLDQRVIFLLWNVGPFYF